jgi:hypothetical protein
LLENPIRLFVDLRIPETQHDPSFGLEKLGSTLIAEFAPDMRFTISFDNDLALAASEVSKIGADRQGRGRGVTKKLLGNNLAARTFSAISFALSARL